LKTFGLDPSKKIKNLSRGMRAQVGLIAAVAHRPELLLLDEPSSGLDAVVRRDILNAIVRTVADDERTVLFSSHLLEEVEQLSDYVTMIQEGRVVLQGSLDEIKEQHHLLNIRLAAPAMAPPVLEGTLSLEGEGRTWTAVCVNDVDRVREGVSKAGGEIVELRNASLQEIFIARVGRKYLPVLEG
jgi:ABC-2 type transport system ATP-binding protein